MDDSVRECVRESGNRCVCVNVSVCTGVGGCISASVLVLMRVFVFVWWH